MLDLKSTYKIIYPISYLSILLIGFSIFISSYNKNSVKRESKLLHLLIGYIIIDIGNFLLIPIFISKFNNSLPLITLNILLESFISLKIIMIEFSSIYNLKKHIKLIPVIFILILTINLVIVNYDIFNTLIFFRTLITLSMFTFCLFLLAYCFSDLKRLKKYKNVTYILFGLVFYYLPLPRLTFDYFIPYFQKNILTIQTAYITGIALCTMNLIRNILLAIYAYNLK